MLFNKMGYKVTKLPTIENQIKWNKYKWLQKIGINTVLDVGANNGKFANDINKILPEAKIFSFEPLHDVYEQLVENTKHINRIKCFNFALGESDTEDIIYRSEYSESSSLLKMGKLHKEAFPYTANSYEEKIQIKKLDSMTDELKIERPLLFKMDVQGYEISVLKGAGDLLKKIDVVITETSYFELYQDQPLFKEIYDYLNEAGFKYVGNMEQFTDPNDGKILQADSIFIKKSLQL